MFQCSIKKNKNKRVFVNIMICIAMVSCFCMVTDGAPACAINFRQVAPPTYGTDVTKADIRWSAKPDVNRM